MLACCLRSIKYIVCIFIILLGYLTFLYKQESDHDSIVIIEKNIGLYNIAEKLYSEKVIKSKYLFIALAKYRAFWGDYIKYGEYKFEHNSNLSKILNKLIEGDVIIHKITIPEGLTNAQIYTLLDSAHGLFGDIDKNFEEGYLLPETYAYKFGDTKNSILFRMNKQMLKYFNGNVDRNVLILASIIEKETGKSSERELISSVFHNRMKIGMPLQSDPTIGYVLGGKVSLTKQDLKIDSPYNTYLYKGLTPTAISNPGKASIYAAKNPAKTNYLYFVSNTENGHHFSENYQQHLEYVSKYRQWEKQKNIAKAF